MGSSNRGFLNPHLKPIDNSSSNTPSVGDTSNGTGTGVDDCRVDEPTRGCELVLAALWATPVDGSAVAESDGEPDADGAALEPAAPVPLPALESPPELPPEDVLAVPPLEPAEVSDTPSEPSCVPPVTCASRSELPSKLL